jgi:hypothetical protein
MKRSFTVITIIFVALIVSCDRGQPRRNEPASQAHAAIADDITLEVSDIPASEAGKPMPVTITFRNKRSVPIRYGHPVGGHDFRLSMVDSQRRYIKVTDLGAKTLGDSISVIQLELAPGQELKQQYDLSELFVFSQPGSYLLTVSRTVDDLDRQMKPIYLEVKDVPVMVRAPAASAR